jgi:hypothetical protein
MNMEYILSCGFAVLLDYTNAVSASCFFDGKGKLFGDSVDLA